MAAAKRASLPAREFAPAGDAATAAADARPTAATTIAAPRKESRVNLMTASWVMGAALIRMVHRWYRLIQDDPLAVSRQGLAPDFLTSANAGRTSGDVLQDRDQART
jgi:hypothetical protein